MLTFATDGRGKSRLSLLRHRHEVVSGMTSSVTQELLGFHYTHENTSAADILNYASSNVSSWTDIHALAARPSSPSYPGRGRLVLLSDSAGHPRYRRTTVRGLIGWAPHWTLLCIPADGSEDTSGKSGSTPPPEDLLGAAAADMDLSQGHMNLCLNLGLPFIVVITKLDLASRAGLRATLAKVFSSLKSAGRNPQVLYDKPTNAPTDFGSVSLLDFEEAGNLVTKLEESSYNIVPIILTSSVKGSGINRLLALLAALPVPKVSPSLPVTIQDTVMSTNSEEELGTLFHIEDVYSNRAHHDNAPMVVLSGLLRHGQISIGDQLYLGPHATDTVEDDHLNIPKPPFKRNAAAPRSYPGALPKTGILDKAVAFESQEEWQTVRVKSLRNLRRPVRTLFADQVGTVGVTPCTTSSALSARSLATLRVRKGMVLALRKPSGIRTITVQLSRPDVPKINLGSDVVVYVGSVRAGAKVIGLPTTFTPASVSQAGGQDPDDGFGFDFEGDDAEPEAPLTPTLMTLEFISSSREFVAVGSQALLMPGGPGLYGGERGEKGVAGLEGYAGVVVRANG